MKQDQEGWAGDITAPNSAKTHYYKDGKSLCGKRLVKKHMKGFNAMRTGSKWSCDCGICIKKHQEILSENPVSYMRYSY